MADNEEKGQITLELVKNEAVVPQPDSLVAAPNGVVCSEIVKIDTEGEFKRGTVLMRVSGGKSFIPSTAEGLANAKEVAILCDDIIIKENTYAECAVYFKGDFNANRVILPYENENDSHEGLIEIITPYLRIHGIYLRGSQE